MKVLVAPSGFKEGLDAEQAANCIEQGILRALPDAIIQKVPLFDGGEGFCKGLVHARKGEIVGLTVMGPLGQPINSYYGIISHSQQKTAVIEMAAVAGLSLIPRNSRNPTITTTYGVGEMVQDSIQRGCKQIIIGCGDSGTSDGGAGFLQALGIRLCDKHGKSLPIAGGGLDLRYLHSLDFTDADPRLKTVQIQAACNWQNVLSGPMGVARIYGPQKGGTPTQVQALAAAFKNYSLVLSRLLGYDVSEVHGSGASGGLGAALLAIGAQLRPRYEAISDYFQLENLFQDCNLVVTAEGAIDFQTSQGKVPAELARRAKSRGIPVIVLAGSVGIGAHLSYRVGIDAYTSILQAPMSLQEAINETERLLIESAEGVTRMVSIGLSLKTASVSTSMYNAEIREPQLV